MPILHTVYISLVFCDIHSIGFWHCCTESVAENAHFRRCLRNDILFNLAKLSTATVIATALPAIALEKNDGSFNQPYSEHDANKEKNCIGKTTKRTVSRGVERGEGARRWKSMQLQSFGTKTTSNRPEQMWLPRVEFHVPMDPSRCCCSHNDHRRGPVANASARWARGKNLRSRSWRQKLKTDFHVDSQIDQWWRCANQKGRGYLLTVIWVLTYTGLFTNRSIFTKMTLDIGTVCHMRLIAPFYWSWRILLWELLNWNWV